MNHSLQTTNRDVGDRDTFAECLAAELTEAAYQEVLRHGVRGSTIDLQLDLWRALAETVKRKLRRSPLTRA